MPDHLHWLIDDGAELSSMVGRFKSYTTWLARRQGHQGRLWQRSFYDHAVREVESLVVIAEYIVRNPIRAELVERWEAYPYAILFPVRIGTLS